MLLNSLIRYVNGNVTFVAENGFGERLINLCATNNITLWDFHKTEVGFQAVCNARDYKKVKEFSQKVNVEVSILRKKGLFFKANKYRKRWGLFGGVIAFFVVLFLSQCFVWEIEVTGNEKVPSGIVLSELKSLGIHRFSFIPSIDFRMKKQEALLAMPQFSWLSINQNGCKLIVEVTERRVPPVIKEDTPCNVVAARTGQIKYMEVYSGERQTNINYTVQKGDLIVKGIYAMPNGNIVKSHASAKVIAEVQFDKSLSLDMNQFSKEYTGKTKKRYYLDLFDCKIPLFIATKMKGDYDVTGQANRISFFGTELPIGIYSLHYQFYEKQTDSISLEEAGKVLSDSFRQYEALELKGSTILDRKVIETLENGVLTRKVSYTVEQDIAKTAEIDPSEIPVKQSEEIQP